MTQHQLSFDRLSSVLEGIADDEVADAISSVRAFRAGRKPVGRQKRLAGLLEALEPDEQKAWLRIYEKIFRFCQTP